MSSELKVNGFSISHEFRLYKARLHMYILKNIIYPSVYNNEFIQSLFQTSLNISVW